MKNLIIQNLHHFQKSKVKEIYRENSNSSRNQNDLHSKIDDLSEILMKSVLNRKKCSYLDKVVNNHIKFKINEKNNTSQIKIEEIPYKINDNQSPIPFRDCNSVQLESSDNLQTKIKNINEKKKEKDKKLRINLKHVIS